MRCIDQSHQLVDRILSPPCNGIEKFRVFAIDVADCYWNTINQKSMKWFS